MFQVAVVSWAFIHCSTKNGSMCTRASATELDATSGGACAIEIARAAATSWARPAPTAGRMACHDSTVHHPRAGAALLRPHRPRAGRAAAERAPRARRARGAGRLRPAPRPCSSSAAARARFAARLLRERLPDDATYLGLDVSPHMVASRARPWRRGPGRAPASSSPTARSASPSRTGPCDRVVSTYVLDLLSPADAAAFVAEARRVLRPGGLLALASLAPGRTPPARLVTRLWQALWSLNPALLGGCRPLASTPASCGLPAPDAVESSSPASPSQTGSCSSDVLVARRR